MEKYENKSIELRKHLKNAIEYMKHDRVNFPLPKTIAFLEGYDAWIKDQKENADQTRGNMSIQVADDKNGDFTIEV